MTSRRAAFSGIGPNTSLIATFSSFDSILTNRISKRCDRVQDCSSGSHATDGKATWQCLYTNTEQAVWVRTEIVQLTAATDKHDNTQTCDMSHYTDATDMWLTHIMKHGFSLIFQNWFSASEIIQRRRHSVDVEKHILISLDAELFRYNGPWCW